MRTKETKKKGPKSDFDAMRVFDSPGANSDQNLGKYNQAFNFKHL